MKNVYFFGLLSILFYLTSCKTTKSKEVELEAVETAEVKESKQHTLLIEMAKGACYGTCPIYNISIFRDGVAKLNGVRFCKKLGPHLTQLSDIELNLLEQKINLMDIENYPEKYKSMIADLPGTQLTFHQKDGILKKVWWNSGAPDELNEMAIVLDKFRTDLEWKVDAKATLPSGTIENQIVVQLKNGIKAIDVAKQFQMYDLIPKRDLMPQQGTWLFEFNAEKISTYEMLNLLNKSEGVRHVELNKELEQRN